MKLNALTSYLRHITVSAIIMFAEKFKLPIEGLEDAANVVALALVGTASWLFVKYLAPLLKENKGVALVAISSLLMIPSCSTIDVRVDKAQVISETDQFIIVPSTAISPYINPSKVNDYLETKTGQYSSKGGLFGE